MYAMFARAPSFNQDISAWDVYTQINLDMSYMFYDASSFNITLCWDLSQIYSDNIFFGAGSNADAIDCTGQPTGQPTTQPTGQPTTHSRRLVSLPRLL